MAKNFLHDSLKYEAEYSCSFAMVGKHIAGLVQCVWEMIEL